MGRMLTDCGPKLEPFADIVPALDEIIGKSRRER